MQEPDDVSLVHRSIAGDSDAFEMLIARYERVAFNVALRMLGNYDDAKDAAQAAFIKVYENLAKFDARFRFFSWMYRILLNECLNVRRSQRPYEQLSAELPVSGPVIDALEAAERRHWMQQSLLALPFDYRQVVVLHYFADLSYDDIAATLGISAKTVKSRLYTARQRLAELLVEEKVRA